MADITEAIRKLVAQTVNNFDLSDILTGTVTSVSPLEIKIDTKITLTDDFLVLTNSVRDYEVDVSFEWQAEENEDAETTPKKAKCTVHNALEVGDNVLLVQQSGAQMFIVLDKIK